MCDLRQWLAQGVDLGHFGVGFKLHFQLQLRARAGAVVLVASWAAF